MIVTEFQHYSLDLWTVEKPINRLLSLLDETGMINEIQRRAKRELQGINNTMVIHQPAMIYAAVKMDELYFIFVVSAVGLTLSFVIFIIEHAIALIWRMQFIQRTKKFNNF